MRNTFSPRTFVATITRKTERPEIGAKESYVILTGNSTQTIADAIHDLLQDCSIVDNIVVFEVREAGSGIYKV